MDFVYYFREPTPQEDGAARVISSSLRVYTRNRLEEAKVPGSAANQEAVDMLAQSLPMLEPRAQDLGATMLQ